MKMENVTLLVSLKQSRLCRARDLSPRRQASADSYRQCSIESVLSTSAVAAAATAAASTMASGHRYVRHGAH